eukprot:921704-Pleurochrysis_carterae.AAC.1
MAWGLTGKTDIPEHKRSVEGLTTDDTPQQPPPRSVGPAQLLCRGLAGHVTRGVAGGSDHALGCAMPSYRTDPETIRCCSYAAACQFLSELLSKLYLIARVDICLRLITEKRSLITRSTHDAIVGVCDDLPETAIDSP